MRKLNAFVFTSLNGYFEGTTRGDISWHKHGEEENNYSIENLQHENILLFGRITYEMMEGFWPTPAGISHDPITAAGMNKAEKIVFSTTMKQANWAHTKIISNNMIEEVMAMKKAPGKNMTVLGSASIITQLAEHNLIDDYQFMVDPVVLGGGNAIFKGLAKPLTLQLTGTRVLNSGVVILSYKPM